MHKVAIVIGGTGVVGRELVTALAQADHIKQVISLTRRPAEHESAKVSNHVIDFDNLAQHQDLFRGDLFFSCLGTTAAQAGTIDAQRKVDLDYQLACATLAAEQGVQDYFLVSSPNANAKSRLPYLKMKGELEDLVKALAFQSITIFQPSLLLGDRHDKRVGEEIAAMIMPLICKLPGLRGMRPITGEQVAAKMVSESIQPKAGIHTLAMGQLFNA